jgi:LysR family transcriptional regulator, transcriptional activator of nhaA
MEWINYHHLLYFWLAAKEGGVTQAAAELSLAQSTVSAQIRQLEHVLDEKLFRREGRRLVLTDVGRTVYRYAEEIFGLGRELLDVVRDRPTGRPLRFNVGVADQVPKLIAHRLLRPALALDVPVRMVCHEGKTQALLAELAVHQLDVVITDAPLGSDTNVRAFNHPLGECGVSIFGTVPRAKAVKRGFPRSLSGAPLLLPTVGTVLRRTLDQWFDAHDVRPNVVAEFEDSTLLTVFGQGGLGLFPGPTAIERDVCKQYGLTVAGRLRDVRERFYAISVERRLRHPAVVAVSEAARTVIA